MTLPWPSIVILELTSNSLTSLPKILKAFSSIVISLLICNTLPLLLIFFTKSSAVFILTSTLEK